ncbi:YicC family protein [Thalassobacter stenotrophicus]|nr:YicC/YloC family endoribonuclease [Thalassobacter stenotrophicus]PVZ50339.1 YicC family protein [Thalassobacter stenotrophicus]
MTGFAALERRDEHSHRSWDVRSVNARGLDIRVRLPDGVDGLEKEVRAALSAAVARGNVSLSLKVTPAGGDAPLRVSPDALSAVLTSLKNVEAEAHAHGMTLAPMSAADILGLRGVLEVGTGAIVTVPLEVLISDLANLIESFNLMRAEEGAALRGILSAQVDEIERLTDAAVDLAQARSDHMAKVFAEAVARVQEANADPEKTAHDIAALAVKADVTEEIDRLRAHVIAARALLEIDGPVGRKFDFLTQEFNREANTMCSKAQFSALTEVGLSLKTVIDQMREQVQNVE